MHGSKSNPAQERCLLTQMIDVHMVKFSFFKSKIIERSRAGHSEFLDLWWKEATEKGHFKKKNAQPVPKKSPLKAIKLAAIIKRAELAPPSRLAAAKEPAVVVALPLVE
mgnify:CR=1 FL=1